LASWCNGGPFGLQQRWDDDIATFDRVYAQAVMMADALSDGIKKQFPAKM